MKKVDSSSRKAKASSQKLNRFMRGSAMWGAPICSGGVQFASPGVAGIAAPNTMTSACMVVIWVKNAGSTSCSPGWKSSLRITTTIVPPTRNMTSENTRYIVPMSLWLVVVSQRMTPFGGPWSCAMVLLRRRREGAALRRQFLLLEPGVEFRLRLRDHDDRHEAVVGAAEFRALPAVGAGLVLVHRDPHLVDESGNRVALHAEGRYPPGVDHVIGGPQHADAGAGRDHERVIHVEQVVFHVPRVDPGAALARDVAGAREPAEVVHAG